MSDKPIVRHPSNLSLFIVFSSQGFETQIASTLCSLAINTTMESVLKKNISKRREEDSQKQNIWTVASVLFAVVVHVLPLQSILGDAASAGIKLFCSIIAAFSIIGAMYIYFIYVLSTRHSTETVKKVK